MYLSVPTDCVSHCQLHSLLKSLGNSCAVLNRTQKGCTTGIPTFLF